MMATSISVVLANGRLQRAAVAGMVMSMLSGACPAAEWTTLKEIAVGGVYTDNLFLTDADTEDSWVTLVTPGIALQGDGRNLDLNLAYAPQYLNYTSGEAGDEFYNRLQFDAESELMEDLLFLDARATAGQGLINVLGPAGGDVTNPTGNVQTIYTYAIAPEFASRFGSGAELTARYENYGVFYSDEGDDAIGNRIDLEVNNGRSLAKTQARFLFTNDYIDYDSDRNKRSTNAGVIGGYVFNRRWRTDAALGYEDNDIDAVTTDTSGLRWEISGSWTPNVRTLLTLGVGRRFFGWTPRLIFSHRSKRSLWSASYIRDLSTAATERREFDVFEFEDAQGEPNLDPITGEPADIPPGAAPPSSSSFVSNTFRTDYVLETRRSRLGANAAYILRQYEDSSRDYSTAWTTVFWNRRLSPVTTGNLRLGWYWTKDEGNFTNSDNAEYTDWTFTAGITRKLTERTEIGAWYRFRDRNSKLSGDDYQENRINLAIRAVWAN